MTQLVLFDANRTPICLSSIIEFVESIFVLQERLVRDLGQRLLIPMVQSVQDDLKDIREQRRSQDKHRDKYETLTAKYGALPKLKEYALIREDTFQLFEGRQQYYEQLLSYLKRIERFRKGADLFFVDKCLGTMETLRDFISAFSLLVDALNGPAQEMRTSWNDWQREMKIISDRMEEEAKSTLQAVRNKFNPDAPYITSGDGTSKHGYLYRRKRRQTASSSAGGTGASNSSSSSGNGSWKRVWLAVNQSSQDGSPDCMLSEWILSKKRGWIECTYEFHVLLCEVRPCDGEHRRHCFEVATSVRSLLYQAETEEEMRDWLRVFENAKAFALQRDQHQDDNATEIASLEAGVASSSDSTMARTVSTSGFAYVGSNNSGLAERLPPSAGNETILAKLQCLWGKSTSSQMTWHFGRLFGTEASICFNSISFGQLREAHYRWKDVIQFEYKIQQLTGTIMLGLAPGTVESNSLTNEMTENPQVKVRIINDEGENVEVLKMLWRNARSPQPRNAILLKQSLRDALPPTETDASQNMGKERRPRGLGLVKCRCPEHLERLEYDSIVPLSPGVLVEIMFGESSPVFQRLVERRKYVNFPKLSAWSDNEASNSSNPHLQEKKRSIEFITPVNHPLVKAKETDCFETQTLSYLNNNGSDDESSCEWYSILQEARTPAVIYGDVFVTQCLFCVTAVPAEPWEEEADGKSGSSRLKIFIGVRFLKNPFVKSMIRSSTLKGLSEYVTDFVACLWAELKHRNPQMQEQRIEERIAHIDKAEEDEGEMANEKATIKGYWPQMAAAMRRKSQNLVKLFESASRRRLSMVLSLLILIACTLGVVLIILLAKRPSGDLFAVYKERRELERTKPLQKLEKFASFDREIEVQRSQIEIAMKELEQAARKLEEEDRRLIFKQYTIWLADQLAQCYLGAIDVRQCRKLEGQWRNLNRK